MLSFVAAVVPMIAGPAIPPAGPATWAPSAAIARVEARQTHRPILALISFDPFRGGRMLSFIENSANASAIAGFVLVHITSADEFVRLDAHIPMPSQSQCIFLDPFGRRLKRSGGFIFPSDLAEACDQARWAMVQGQSSPVHPTSNSDLRRAKFLAMRGDVSAAEQLLQRTGDKALTSDRAEVYSAIADEFRAQGELGKSVKPFRQAIALTSNAAQSARWRARLGLSLVRSGDWDTGLRELRVSSTSPALEKEDRDVILSIADRFASMANARVPVPNRMSRA